MKDVCNHIAFIFLFQIWHVSVGDEVKVEFAADLNRHQKSVNVVRFSPSGEYLASGDDGKEQSSWG
jgi:chromatin assembly factor 1 subunit B